MPDLILPDNHYSRSISNNMTEICNFFLQYEISYFSYGRLYTNGSTFFLTNRWDSFQHHCQKQYIFCPPVSDTIFQKKNFYILPLPEEKSGFNQVMFEYSNLFNVGSPIYLVEQFPGHTDVFAFAATPKNTTFLTYYMNNTDILNKLKFYFKEKAQHLIRESNKHRILLPKHMYANLCGITKIENDENRDLIQINKYFLSKNNLVITKREHDVIKCLARGLTIKEVAQDLKISPRTAETYYNSVKFKLGLERKFEVIQVLSDLNLL